jgi:hypothetical protein
LISTKATVGSLSDKEELSDSLEEKITETEDSEVSFTRAKIR